RSGTPSRMRRVIALSPMRDFRPLAEQGNARAQFYLGAMYHYGGHGVTQDDVEAAKWFRKAAEQGDVTSQFIIGSMYSVGEGVPRNYAEAKKWWLLAVKKGHADAQLGLGDIYKRGYGVPQNYILAYMWYAISAHDPEYKSDAESHLNEITPDMAPSQIAE